VQKIGAPDFDQHVKKAESITEVLFAILAKKYDLNTLAGKTHFVQEALELIEKMPHGIYHAVLSEKLAKIAEIDLKTVVKRSEAPTFKPSSFNQNAQSKLVQMATTLLLKSPDLAYEIEDLSGLQRIQIAGVDRLIVLIQTLKKKPTMGIGELLSEWEDPSARQAIAELAATELFIPPTGYREEFNGAIERLLSQAQSKTTQGLIHKSRTQGLSSDERDQLATLLSEKKNEDNVL
jgi:DNA primase